MDQRLGSMQEWAATAANRRGLNPAKNSSMHSTSRKDDVVAHQWPVNADTVEHFVANA